jgi:hypothetical protein
MSKQDTTFLAPGKGLSVTSDNWAYAYSGIFEASTANATMFDFQTPKGILKGEFTFNGQVRYIVGSSGGHSVFRISLNGQVVSITKCDTAGNDSPVQTFQKVVIPPNTRVLVECISGEDTANELLTATFSGRFYG